MQINSISSNNGGINVNELFTTCVTDLNTYGTALEARIKELSEDGATIDQTDMLEVQFYIGQYNAMLEMVSSVSKSLTDMMKTLAQRSS